MNVPFFTLNCFTFFDSRESKQYSHILIIHLLRTFNTGLHGKYMNNLNLLQICESKDLN